jgi:tetratricopeptide (TPR) repeat protein
MVMLFVVSAVVPGPRTYSIVRQVAPNRVDPAAYQRALDQNARVPAGFLVLSVRLRSKAVLVGLQPGDIITNYNGTGVTNYASYRAAVDGNLADKATSVTLTVYRAGSPLQISAPPGLLGFDGRDWTPLSDIVVKMIRADRTDQAKALLAGSDKSIIPPEELLTVRLLLMGEHDPGSGEVLRQLMTHRVRLDTVATKFMDASQYKTAQTLLLKAVEADPEDISAKINLVVAYDWAGQFDDADRAIQDVLAHHRDDLADYGWFLLLKARGDIYISRKNYVAAAADLQKAIELVPDEEDRRVRLRYLFALAKLGDAQEFERGVAFCEKYSIQETPKLGNWIDALRAYVLSRNGAEAEAKATVEKWRNDANRRKTVVEYWSAVPGGADVAETWDRLLK